MGKKLLYRGLDAAFAGAGKALEVFDKVLETITGISVGKTAVIILALLVFGVPLLLLMLLFIMNNNVNMAKTTNNPVVHTLNKQNKNSWGWNEFEKKFLSIK